MNRTYQPQSSWRVIVLALFATCASISNGEDTRPPHIICYVADDFGVRDSGAYGQRFVNTPHIDRLASEGLRFTNAFAGSPTCAPSRSILYTGLMSARTGAHPNHWAVNAGTKSIGHHLAALGYHVAVINKVHVKPPESFPFETVKAIRKQPQGGGNTIDVAAFDSWLERQLTKNPTQPLCLFLCDNNTHLAWPDATHPNQDRISVPPYLPNSPATRESMARYYTEVELLDERVGECIEICRKHGIYEHSLFVFTADQGPAWLHGKWNLYDLGVHVPFIARWPDTIPAGTTSDALISLVDVTPTLVDIAGGKPLENLDGRSFQTSLHDPKQPHREHLFATHTGDGIMNNYPCRAIRTERFKLIWNLRPDLTYTSFLTNAKGKDRRDLWRLWEPQRKSNSQIDRAMSQYQRRPEFELYDLRADPDELTNLADSDDYAQTLQRLHAQLEAWMTEQKDQRRDMTSFLDDR